jgi:hypothetical protein
MAVEKIEILVGYSRLLDSWIADASMQVDTVDPIMILKKTSEVHGRTEVLNFLKNNKTMVAEEIFSIKERKIIEEALVGVT